MKKTIVLMLLVPALISAQKSGKDLEKQMKDLQDMSIEEIEAFGDAAKKEGEKLHRKLVDECLNHIPDVTQRLLCKEVFNP